MIIRVLAVIYWYSVSIGWMIYLIPKKKSKPKKKSIS